LFLENPSSGVYCIAAIGGSDSRRGKEGRGGARFPEYFGLEPSLIVDWTDEWRGQNRPLSVGDCVEAGVVAATDGEHADSTRLLQDIISDGD